MFKELYAESWQEKYDRADDYEYIAQGHANVWVIEMGSKAENGSFEAFMDGFAGKKVCGDTHNLIYQSPSQGEITFGWNRPLTVGEKPSASMATSAMITSLLRRNLTRAQSRSMPAVIRRFLTLKRPSARIFKALPHNSSAALAMPFLPSASCRNLDLPPVNLRFLQSHLTKNAFAIAPTHSCGIALELYCIIFPEQNCMPVRSNQIISRPNQMDC